MANLLGPVLGGILASARKWRVMFAMNIPFATVAFILLFVAGPEEPGPAINRAKWGSMDWIGGLLSIVWVAPIVLALQEGGSEWGWGDAIIQMLLIGGGLLMAIFICYEFCYVTKRKTKIDPVFPVSLFRIVPIFWLMVNALFVGATFYGGITLLPSRFQIVNNLSAKDAGLYVLLMMMTVPMGAFTGAELSHRFIHGAQWVALAGSTMVLIGTVLLAFLAGGLAVPLISWFAQCHLGIGFGLLGAIALFIQKDNVSYYETAFAVSIYDMVRAMGGTIGVAICSSINHNNLRKEFTKVLPAADVESLMESNFGSITDLSPENQGLAREAYGHVFAYQFRAIAIAAGINVLVAMTMVWTRYFVGFSLERRGDGPYQHWRQEDKGNEEDGTVENGAVDNDPSENVATGNDIGEDDVGENNAGVVDQKRSSPRSPAPKLPRLNGFENISMRDV